MTPDTSKCDPFPAGFVEPGSTYRGDAADAGAAPQLFRATKLSVDHNPADYEVKQVGRASADTPTTE